MPTCSSTTDHGGRASQCECEEDEAIEAMHNRNLRVSFTWMPAPSVFGWRDQRERQRDILERAGEHFDSGRLRVQVEQRSRWTVRPTPTEPSRRAR